MGKLMKAKPFLAATVLSLCAASAQAQEFVRSECVGVVQVSARMTFDSAEHRNWYRRFWTGDCKSLPALRCMPGSPNWNDVITKLVKKGRADQAPAITTAACRMGETIGHEWAREKAVRRIDTADLKAFLVTLDTAPDVTTGLSRVELRVKTALGLKP
jgi:hypothetical protein